MLEFSLVLPVFLLLVLGMIQLSLIFINIAMLKYAAFMTARVAVAYPEDEQKEKRAAQASGMAATLMTAVNNSNNLLSTAAIKEAAMTYLDNKLSRDRVSVTVGKVEGISHMDFVRVEIRYRMPLKVPVVNRAFSLFSSDGDKGLDDRALNKMKFPVRDIKAYSLMSVR